MKTGCGCLSCIGCLVLGLLLGIGFTIFFYPTLREKGWTFEAIAVEFGEAGDKVKSVMEPNDNAQSDNGAANITTSPPEPEKVLPPAMENRGQ